MGGLFSPRNNKNTNNNNKSDEPVSNPSNNDDILSSIKNSSNNNCCITCKTCKISPTISENENGIFIEQNCETCIEGYNLLFNTNNCYNSSIKEIGYYLSSNDSKYHKCDIQCNTCEDSLNEPH